MSKHYLIVGMATVVTGIIVWLWLGNSDTHSDAPELAATALPATAVDGHSSAVPTADATEVPVPKEMPTSISQPQDDGQMNGQPPAHSLAVPEMQSPVDDYLSKHSRDARSLLQAFRIAKNKDYLNEARKRFPDDPMVLLHCVLYDTDPTEARKSVLLRLQELLPDDAVPFYLLGEQLLKEGDFEAALNCLMTGSLKPYANSYATEIISDNQDFLVTSGVPPADALAQACFDLELRLLSPMRKLIGLLQNIHADKSAEGDADIWAIAGAHVAQSMHEQMSLFLIDELVSMVSEKKFLSLLPPETELVAGGITVAQRSKEVEDFFALVRSFPLRSDAALTLTPEKKMLFFKKLQNEGEIAALLWLNSGQETVTEEAAD